MVSVTQKRKLSAEPHTDISWDIKIWRLPTASSVRCNVGEEDERISLKSSEL